MTNLSHFGSDVETLNRPSGTNADRGDGLLHLSLAGSDELLCSGRGGPVATSVTSPGTPADLCVVCIDIAEANYGRGRKVRGVRNGRVIWS